MAEEKWVTWDGLKYYDSKVKSHIDSKLSDLQSNVPSDQEFNELKERVEDIANEQSQTSAKVDSFQDHIDENEAAIEDLRKFDLKVTSDISALQTHMEYTVKKEDLNSYATEEFVADAIRSAQLSGDIDLSDYYKKGDVDALVVKVQGNIDVTETKINGLSNKINDVSSDVEKNHEIIEQLLVSIENKADEQHQHHLSDIIDYEEPDLTNYATKDDVKDAIDNLLIPDFDNYYTKSEIDKMIPELDNLVTKQELDILTNAVSDVAESLDEKADKSDLEGLATKAQVDEQVATKANDIPFTTDMFVTDAQGGFANGDNLKGMSIESILTKLLGLQSVITPDEPDIPDEPTTIVDKIIAEQIPMYSVSANGELISTDFHLIDGNTEPTESGFYVINDELGNILEAGYQDLQVENDEIYYVIALPKEVNYNTVVKVQTYDPDDKMWVDSRIDLTADPDIVDSCCEEAGIDITHIDTNKYTVWVQESICTGSIIRYRIVEEN